MGLLCCDSSWICEYIHIYPLLRFSDTECPTAVTTAISSACCGESNSFDSFRIIWSWSLSAAAVHWVWPFGSWKLILRQPGVRQDIKLDQDTFYYIVTIFLVCRINFGKSISVLWICSLRRTGWPSKLVSPPWMYPFRVSSFGSIWIPVGFPGLNFIQWRKGIWHFIVMLLPVRCLVFVRASCISRTYFWMGCICCSSIGILLSEIQPDGRFRIWFLCP